MNRSTHVGLPGHPVTGTVVDHGDGHPHGLEDPAVNDPQFNSGVGVHRVGRRADTAIGRFLRLCTRNLAGLRIPAGMDLHHRRRHTCHAVPTRLYEQPRARGAVSLEVDLPRKHSAAALVAHIKSR